MPRRGSKWIQTVSCALQQHTASTAGEEHKVPSRSNIELIGGEGSGTGRAGEDGGSPYDNFIREPEEDGWWEW